MGEAGQWSRARAAGARARLRSRSRGRDALSPRRERDDAKRGMKPCVRRDIVAPFTCVYAVCTPCRRGAELCCSDPPLVRTLALIQRREKPDDPALRVVRNMLLTLVDASVG